MTVISALQNVHIEGSFGNFENKSENELLKIKELKNLLIVQIVQYKNSSIKIDDINFNNLKFVNQAQKVVSNEKLQKERVDAFKSFHEDTINKKFNDPKITVGIESKEYEKFLKLAEKF